MTMTASVSLWLLRAELDNFCGGAVIQFRKNLNSIKNCEKQKASQEQASLAVRSPEVKPTR